MLTFNFSLNIFLGIIVGVSVVGLYSLRNLKPELARDEDIFATTIGLLYSCILMVHGWRLDPILLFSQILVIALFLGGGLENLKLRIIITDIANLKKKINHMIFYIILVSSF